MSRFVPAAGLPIIFLEFVCLPEDFFLLDALLLGGVRRSNQWMSRGLPHLSCHHRIHQIFLALPCPQIRVVNIGLGTKKNGNGNVQANVRANNSRQFEGTAHENVGFRGNKGQKVHPNFALNITMEFHYHAFCAPDKKFLDCA